MKDLFIGSLLFIFVFVGTFYLFPTLSVSPTGVTPSDPSVMVIFWPELIFLFGGAVLFLLLAHMRTLVLIILIFGQMSLLLHNEPAWIFGVQIPFYGIIAINGVGFLLLYFLFASHLWAPAELQVEDFD